MKGTEGRHGNRKAGRTGGAYAREKVRRGLIQSGRDRSVRAVSIRRMSHVGVCVRDLERSLAFYTTLLGFREVGRGRYRGAPVDALLELHGVDLRAVWLERDGVRIELLAFSAPPGPPETTSRPLNTPGLTHLSLRVDDLDATVAGFRTAGVDVLDHTRFDDPDHDSAAVFVRDPDGTPIELVQSPGDPDAPPGL